jgi:hypothetical protein
MSYLGYVNPFYHLRPSPTPQHGDGLRSQALRSGSPATPSRVRVHWTGCIVLEPKGRCLPLRLL